MPVIRVRERRHGIHTRAYVLTTSQPSIFRVIRAGTPQGRVEKELSAEKKQRRGVCGMLGVRGPVLDKEGVGAAGGGNLSHPCCRRVHQRLTTSCLKG